MNDDFYHSKRWKNLRWSVLRDDGYMCQRCRVKGKFVQAEHVHHIFPIEKYDRYKWDRWNLISLCWQCHAEMHNRFNGELSKTGEILLRATAAKRGIKINVSEQTILVVGLRGHGKSTYVRNHMDENSIGYDMDAIASAFRLRQPHEEYFKPARRMANDFLFGFLAKAHEYCKTVFVIRTAPTIKEVEQINPTKIVFCEKEFNRREMDDRKGAEDRLERLKEHAKRAGTEIEIQ